MTSYNNEIYKILSAIKCSIGENGTSALSRTITTNHAYETLENGAVERLDKHIEAIDGAIQPYTFTHFGSGITYTPTDSARITPKPIKVQIGLGHENIEGVTGLSDIPTVTNSQGVEFPQSAFIHVEAESGAGAGIAYTTDSTAPTNDKKFQVGVGNGFSLDSNAEIKGFRAVAIDGRGDVDTSLSVGITIEYNNIDVKKDDI